jgi:hypothetical protein
LDGNFTNRDDQCDQGHLVSITNVWCGLHLSAPVRLLDRPMPRQRHWTQSAAWATYVGHCARCQAVPFAFCWRPEVDAAAYHQNGHRSPRRRLFSNSEALSPNCPRCTAPACPLKRNDLRLNRFGIDRDRGEPCSSAHRVTGGGRPPPVPTERSVRIYRTTLFGRCFTALQEPATPRMGGAALVSVTASLL